MILTDGKVKLIIENENHVAAFLSSGWIEVKEEAAVKTTAAALETKEAEEEKKPKKTRKTK